MFIEAVPKKLKSNLEALGKEPLLRQFYLAGGTALALQLGHRISYDLDFFTPQSFSERKIIELLEKLGKTEIDLFEESTLLGRLNGVKISFFFYRYPLIFPAVSYLGVRLADVREIGAMKIDAIQSRGRKRDFIDLWALLGRGISLAELFESFEKKYRGVKYNKQHILKSLVYFEDAERDEMPPLLKKISWKEVKATIEEEVRKFLDSQI